MIEFDDIEDQRFFSRSERLRARFRARERRKWFGRNYLSVMALLVLTIGVLIKWIP